MKGTIKTRRPSKAEILANQVMRDHRDFSTYEIVCRLQTLHSSIKDTDETIANLRAKLSQLSIRLQADRATAAGLDAVLESRR